MAMTPCVTSLDPPGADNRLAMSIRKGAVLLDFNFKPMLLIIKVVANLQRRRFRVSTVPAGYERLRFGANQASQRFGERCGELRQVYGLDPVSVRLQR